MAKPNTTLIISNIAGYIFLIAVNVAASRGWLGPTNEKLSKKNHTPITPAGWAFSIWGLIFLLQGAGVVYQVLDHGYESESKAIVVEAIGYWWIVGWLCECAWQYFFQWQTTLGMRICMCCLLSGLSSFAVALSNLYRVREEGTPIDLFLYIFYLLPTSINTAWLSVASCIGILIVANVHNIPHLEYGAILLAALSSLAGAYLVVTKRDTAYGLVLIWALTAVFTKQNKIVGVAALVCIAINIVCVVNSLIRRRSALVEGDYVQGYSEL